MSPRHLLGAGVLLVLLVGGALVLLGDIEQGVDLSSVLEVWADVLRDADQFGLRLTRVSDREEMEVGREIADQITRWWSEDPEWTPYVAAVAETLLPHLRRKGIRYEVRVIKSPQINAFALPGGQVFVLTGMLEFLETEAELAAVLGHEISHVDLRHCIERFQYELALRKVGARELGQMAEIARMLLTVGYNKYQELEADAQGVRLSIQAGYDPDAGAAVFERLQRRFGLPQPRPARTPVGEVIKALEEAMGSYLHSHPASSERTRRLKELVARNRPRLSEGVFYVGRANYRLRVPRTRQEFPEERQRISPGQAATAPAPFRLPLKGSGPDAIGATAQGRKSS